MRRGFTMIELIFVIVILGILAAVALPKLAATRDDAQIAKAATEVTTAISDVGSYYTAKGAFGDISEMTNVPFTGNLTNGTGTLTYQVKKGSAAQVDCLSFQFASDLGTVQITPSGSGNGTGGSGEFCTKVKDIPSVKKVLDSSNGTQNFGGSNINFE